MQQRGEREYRKDVRIVAALAILVSVGFFCWYFFHGEILLYGDAVAHINIARRVFDSRDAGLLRFGTVWLPFPHAVMIPFIIGHQMWTSGWGASIPSMFAFVLGAVGIFRLVGARASRPSAFLAAGVFALNPNLLYMQSTAMTESIFLAEFVWVLVYLDEFLRGVFPNAQSAPARIAPAKALERCALVLGAAILTRYDGWVFTAVVGLIVTVALARSWKRQIDRKSLFRSYILFLVFCAVLPILWFAQNYALSSRPLDFLNGPYSAKAIEQRSLAAGNPPHPGTGNVSASAIFFLKASKLNVAEGNWQPLLFVLALTGTALTLLAPARFGIFLLLWFPLPFYAYAIAYGSIPIFMPVWWPFSYYNVRYGLELLPAFAVFIALNFEWFRDMPPLRLRQAVIIAISMVGIGSYLSVSAATPICLREARVNSVDRIQLEEKLAKVLQELPENSSILMQTSQYVGALQRAGIRIRRVIFEDVHPEWEKAMSAPSDYSDYVVATQGDQLWYATKLFPQGLQPIAKFEAFKGKTVIVFKTVHH